MYKSHVIGEALEHKSHGELCVNWGDITQAHVTKRLWKLYDAGITVHVVIFCVKNFRDFSSPVKKSHHDLSSPTLKVRKEWILFCVATLLIDFIKTHTTVVDASEMPSNPSPFGCRSFTLLFPSGFINYPIPPWFFPGFRFSIQQYHTFGGSPTCPASPLGIRQGFKTSAILAS